jgi:hypothetical protein
MSTTTSTPSKCTTVTIVSSAFAVDVAVITEVDASAEALWAALTDTATFPKWNPFITRLDGELVVGGKVTAVLQLAGRKPQTMTPKIIELSPGRSFTWLGGFGFRGVFDGRHHFEVEAIATDRCRFVHQEHLSGVLVPLFRSMLTSKTPDAFVAMNTALAALVSGHV